MKHDKTLQNTWKPYMGKLIYLDKSDVYIWIKNTENSNYSDKKPKFKIHEAYRINILKTTSEVLIYPTKYVKYLEIINKRGDIVLIRCGALIIPLKEVEIVPFTKVKFFSIFVKNFVMPDWHTYKEG